jgi:hypothetical protein
MHGTHDQALALLERVDEKQRSCQATLAAIDNALQGVLVAQGTTTLQPSNAGSTDMSHHLVVLRKSIATTISAVSNPFLRNALQEELDSVLQKLATCLAQVSDHDLELIEAPKFRVPVEPTPQPRNTKTYTKLIGSFATASVLGTLHLSTTLTTTFVPHKRGISVFQQFRSTHTKAVLHPARWLQQCGLHRGFIMRLSLNSLGLDCSLKSYRAVPDNAPVFDYCRDGNIKAVQALFDSGLASPWDANSRGFTPLFVSVCLAYPRPRSAS